MVASGCGVYVAYSEIVYYGTSERYYALPCRLKFRGPEPHTGPSPKLALEQCGLTINVRVKPCFWCPLSAGVLGLHAVSCVTVHNEMWKIKDLRLGCGRTMVLWLGGHGGRDEDGEKYGLY